MIGHLYRYPHPYDPTKFIYVGQGAKRDGSHRSGKIGFGRRFKNLFPNIELPKPILEEVEVKDQLELNELETIWMFRFHTWRGYEGGMNLTFPGDTDYKNIARLGGLTGAGGKVGGSAAFMLKVGVHGRAPEQMIEDSRKAGRLTVKRRNGIHGRTPEQIFIDSQKGGLKNVESGQIQALGYSQGLIQGRKNVENGHLFSICSEGGKVGGAANSKSGQIQKLGKEQGRKNADSGFLASLLTPEILSKAGTVSSTKRHLLKDESGKSVFAIRMGKKSVHARLHIKRNIINPHCEFCTQILSV